MGQWVGGIEWAGFEGRFPWVRMRVALPGLSGSGVREGQFLSRRKSRLAGEEMASIRR